MSIAVGVDLSEQPDLIELVKFLHNRDGTNRYICRSIPNSMNHRSPKTRYSSSQVKCSCCRSRPRDALIAFRRLCRLSARGKLHPYQHFPRSSSSYNDLEGQSERICRTIGEDGS
jgi:hypothetical protein